jgi:arsenate reductase-like glutaredoxin family protein
MSAVSYPINVLCFFVDSTTFAMGGFWSSSKEPPEKPISKEELEKLNEKREAIVKEILTTEQTYVKNLDILCSIWLKPLEDAALTGKPILKPPQIAAIFSIVREILNFHRKFLEQLEKRINKWNDKQLLGDVFVNNANGLKLYTDYVNNYDNALATLGECQTKKKFRKYLEACRARPECQQLDLPSFLIMPIQRIPRYQLLLQDLVNSTRRNHKDYKHLRQALEAIITIAKYVNEQKRNYEEMQKVIELQEEFSDNWTLSAPHRRLVKDAKCASKEHYFLFNDILAITTEQKGLLPFLTRTEYKYKVQAIAPLLCVELIEQPENSKNNAVKVQMCEKGFVLYFDTPEAKAEFVKLVNDTKAKAVELKNLTLKHIPINKEDKKSSEQVQKMQKSLMDNTNSPHQKKESFIDKISYHPIGFIKSLVTPSKSEKQDEKSEKSKNKEK